jgi:hypothetical protein
MPPHFSEAMAAPLVAIEMNSIDAMLPNGFKYPFGHHSNTAANPRQ